MSQEATMIAVDNSDFMRNGDFIPTRLDAQNEAVSLICQCKRQGNPENTFGLVSLANTEVLCTLTTDISKIYTRLHLVQPNGNISFCTSIKIAHLALRHRQVRHQKMRIVCFVGSPIQDDEKDMIKLAKRLKKEKVNVDVVNFGEDECNQKKLLEFVDTVNGKDAGGSHLITVPPGTILHDSLVTSPIVAGEDGAAGVGTAGLGLEFGLEAAEDADLLYALRVSMEDQRMRQEHEATAGAPPVTQGATLPGVQGTSEEAMLRQALALSMEPEATPTPAPAEDLSAMTEDEQIHYALRMSMQPDAEKDGTPVKKADDKSGTAEAMEVDKPSTDGGLLATALKDHDTTTGSSSNKPADQAYNPPGYDLGFIHSVLKDLPGVETENADVQNAISSLTKEKEEEKKFDKGGSK